ECASGPIDAKKWAGGSGALAFDSPTRVPLAVIIQREEEGKTLPHLPAVPICYLLDAPETKESFRSAIQYETYQHREEHHTSVKEVIRENLQGLEQDEVFLKKLAEEIHQVVEPQTSGLDIINSNMKILAQQVAGCLVDHHAVVIDPLVDLMRGSTKHEHVIR